MQKAGHSGDGRRRAGRRHRGAHHSGGERQGRTKAPGMAGPSDGPSPAVEGPPATTLPLPRRFSPATTRTHSPAAGGRSSCAASAPLPPLPSAGNSSAVTPGTGPPGPPPYGTRRGGRPLPAPGRPRRTAPRPIGSGGRAKLLPGPAARPRRPLPRSAQLNSARLARCRRRRARGCGPGKGRLGRGARRGDTAPLPGRPGKRSPGGGAAPPPPLPLPARARGAASAG